MSKSVISDLSDEKPGRHNFQIKFRIPVADWRVRLSAKSPDRAPAATAMTALALALAGLAIPLIPAMTASHARLPSWTILAAAGAFTTTMIGETLLALWWEHGRVHHQDLAEAEGDPTDHAIVLIEHLPAGEQQTLELEAGMGQQIAVAVNWGSPARSLAGLGMALLILAVAALIPAAAFTGLAATVSASAPVTLAAAILAFTTAAACGTFMLVRVEQFDRDTTRRERIRP